MPRAPARCRECGEPGARPYVVQWPLKRWMCPPCGTAWFKARRRAALADMWAAYGPDVKAWSTLKIGQHFGEVLAAMSHGRNVGTDEQALVVAAQCQAVRYFRDFGDEAHRAIPGRGDNSRALGHAGRAAVRVVEHVPYDVAWLRRLYDYLCVYCAVKGRGHHLDHLWPLKLSGPDVPWNIVPACPACNLSKGAKPVHEWLPGRLEALDEGQADRVRAQWRKWMS